ncbi:sulfite exporter TauE/SafE family protein [Fluviicola sp.]|uniref:sulfite exporter TauE/SafE family protein n=1 Tax=Fluviicola sp. TaxID=1917219 RepID=UPI002614820C|nr:sulfite exporter TauE/SafE family protein [Fluviicola sp.]
MATILIILFIVSFLAFSISAICGGGAGLMLIPILGQLVAVSQVPAALSIGTFTSSASRLVVFRKNIRWSIVKYFVPAALPAVWLGAWLLKYVNPVYLEIAMGLFLVSNLTFLFKKPKELSETEIPATIKLTSIGFLAGFLSGLTGAVGLLFNRFYLRYGLTKEEIVATRAANEIMLHLVKIVLYFLFGLITGKVIYIGIVVAASAIFSTIAMKWILPHLSEVSFKKIGYSAMVLSGFVMLSQSGADLFISKNPTTAPHLQAYEQKLNWQHANYELEFTYDHGFEFEQVIPITELSREQQDFVKSRMPAADKIVIEAVYGIDNKSFEAYYFQQNKLVDKIDFI